MLQRFPRCLQQQPLLRVQRGRFPGTDAEEPGVELVRVREEATAALDAVRRGLWNQLRRDGKTDQAKALKGSRWALLKNPPDLTGDQRTTVATIAKTNHPLYRAYLLKDLYAPGAALAGR